MSDGIINADSSALAIACPVYVCTPFIVQVPYPIGYIYYVAKRAQRGVLEAVAIKKYIIVNSRRTFGIPSIVYVDTLNTLWNQADLCTQGEAVAFAIAYYEELLTQITC